MSLLDDVSIVVTPNGYKAGELYAVVPVPVEGAEEGTNMDFSSGTSPWALNSNWSLGGVGVIADGTSNSTIWQSAVVEDNKQYIVTYTLTDFLQGSINVDLSGGNGITRTVAGTYTEAITAGTFPTTRLSFEGSGNFKVTLSNVIVKEYTSADMDVTRATAATRVDEDGLVNYAEIIGSELAVCGDFECVSPLTGWTVNADGEISIDSGRLKVLNVTNRGRSYRTYTGLTIGKTYRSYVGNINGTTSGFNHITGISSNVPLNQPFYFVAIGTTVEFQCGVGTVDATDYTYFDNISLKEVTRDNVPRIDYTGGGCPHILAEPQRTNLVTYSSDFSSWTAAQSSVTLTSNAAISPEGLQNATQIVFSDNTQTQLFQYIAAVSGTVYTTSTFIKYKSGTDRNIKIGVYDSEFKVIQLNFNTDGTIASTSTSGTLVDSGYEDYGNGWYRAYIVHTGATTGNIEVQFNRVGLSNTNEQFYIYGSQLEVGSYPTSIIPTSGSTVTRNQDIFTRDGIGSLINDSEGVLFAEWKPKISSDYSFFSINNGTSSEIVTIGKSNNTTSMFVGVRTTGGYQLLYNSSSHDLTIFNKVAVKWKSGDMAVWVNGVEVLTGTSTNLPNGMNKLSFDFGDGGFDFYGKVKQLQVYNTALTDTQLAALTS